MQNFNEWSETYDNNNLIVYNSFVKNESLLRAVTATWPPADYDGWHTYNDIRSYKYATRARSDVPTAAGCLLDTIATQFTPDKTAFPDFEFHGAGLHELPPGGFLAAHLDAEIHPRKPWSRAYSGVLLLDDVKDGGKFSYSCVDGEIVELSSAFNRFILFKCTDTARHQVTISTTRRRALCLFWWRLDQGPRTGRRDRALFFGELRNSTRHHKIEP